MVIESGGLSPNTTRFTASRDAAALADRGKGGLKYLYTTEGERLHQQAGLQEPALDRCGQRNQPAQVECTFQDRASVSDAQAPLGIRQGSLSWLGQERQSRVRHAGDAQPPQMGTTTQGRVASGVSQGGRKSPHLPSKPPAYSMKIPFASQSTQNRARFPLTRLLDQ